MNLRPQLSSRSRPPRWLLVALAVLAVGLVSLGGVTGRANASVTNNYSSTLYLTSTASALLGSGSYQLVTTAPSSVSTATQNRIPLSTTGYQDFKPGVSAPTVGQGNSPVDGASASTTPDNAGWIVDGSGAVSFPAGPWTFKAIVQENYTSGAASLAVGMWKVTVSGGAIAISTLLVDPNCSATPCASGAAPGLSGTNFIIPGTSSTTVSIAPSLNGFSLASNEHLYVQYWRKQTTGIATISRLAWRRCP